MPKEQKPFEINAEAPNTFELPTAIDDAITLRITIDFQRRPGYSGGSQMASLEAVGGGSEETKEAGRSASVENT